jgi:hypothetical protein
MEDRDVQFANFRIAIETAAEHIESARAHDGREMGGEKGKSNAQDYEQNRRDPKHASPDWLAYDPRHHFARA